MKRSEQANKYYRHLLGLIAVGTPHDADALHEFLKRKFLLPETLVVFGQKIDVYTTRIESAAFARYVDRVRAFAREELGIETPEADPALRDDTGAA